MYKVLSDFFLLKRKEVLTTLTFVRIAFRKEIWLGVCNKIPHAEALIYTKLLWKVEKDG
jgi:hypothetical protein